MNIRGYRMESSKIAPEIKETRYKLRSTMQLVQSQFDTLLTAVESCANIESLDESKSCLVAVESAHRDVLRFIELNVHMALLTDELSKACLKKYGVL